MNEVDAIKEARALLSAPGSWCKGGNPKNGLCVMGAVCVALGQEYFMHYHACDERVQKAKELLRLHVPGGVDAWVYNDEDATTHQDILNLLDKTLADLGALA